MKEYSNVLDAIRELARLDASGVAAATGNVESCDALVTRANSG